MKTQKSALTNLIENSYWIWSQLNRHIFHHRFKKQRVPILHLVIKFCGSFSSGYALSCPPTAAVHNSIWSGFNLVSELLRQREAAFIWREDLIRREIRGKTKVEAMTEQQTWIEIYCQITVSLSAGCTWLVSPIPPDLNGWRIELSHWWTPIIGTIRLQIW